MSWSNYHSHCSFCDGKSSMEDFVIYAISKNLKKYGFSSHAPLPFRTNWNMKLDDFTDYQTEFRLLKEKYASNIELFLGLEVDYIHNFLGIKNELYSTADFDYLIGSVHFMDQLPNGEFWCIDGDFDIFNAGLETLFDGDIRSAVERFFEITTEMIHKGGFDIVGHLDKIAMNASKCEGFDVAELWYRNLVGEVLQLIKNKQLILEINSKSLINIGITYPNFQFFPLINELQIPVVLNSDCHYPTSIINGFEPTLNVLKTAGFKSLHQIVNGKWQAVEFDEIGVGL